jgi:hypothetical protein
LEQDNDSDASCDEDQQGDGQLHGPADTDAGMPLQKIRGERAGGDTGEHREPAVRDG